MKTTYRAMQTRGSGLLELVERPVPEPAEGQVLIAVEACGICGADVHDVEGAVAPNAPPRVPGHEVVGRIAALGPGNPPLWQVGQRVGVGRLGGHCNACPQCRQGQFPLCLQQPIVGSGCDGGYAEMMIARGTGLIAIPQELSSEEAAPILCAGIATFNALRRSGAQAGDLVAVLGIGGLGHMALQYAQRMGFRVAAIGRGADVAQDARALGAHLFIDTDREDVAARLGALGGAQAVVATIGHGELLATLVNALSPRGRLIVLGGGRDPLSVSLGALVRGERSVQGSITGSPFECERALDFSLLTGVRPLIETMPLEQAQDAYRRMKSGQARYRMVLTMDARSPGARPGG